MSSIEDGAQIRHFDAIVVGTGQAGPYMAARLATAGRRVAVVERARFGGTCVNTGCTPTKAMVASAYVARQAVRAAEYGVLLAEPPRVDLRAVTVRADGIVRSHRDGLEAWLTGMAGCTVLRGHARFEAPHTLRVGTETITAPQIFLNVGGRARIPDLPGLDTIDYLTNTGIVTLDHLPRHLVIIGGSYIGLEFAQMYRRFGAAVTVVERMARLLPHEDEEISQEVQQILDREGVVFRLDAGCIGVGRHAEGVRVTIDCASGDREIIGSHVLLAVGRRPNTDDLGLERAGVATDAHGYIVVDDQLRTGVEGIWALGDCNGRGAFTHTSYNDFEIVAANLLDGGNRSLADRIPAYALYIDPPLGHAGLTETQARAAGRRVRVGKRPMTRVARAVEKGEAQGLMKLVVDAETNAILGATIIGPGGDEAVHGILDVMSARAPYTTLARTMPIHPTVSELIPTVLGELGPAS